MKFYSGVTCEWDWVKVFIASAITLIWAVVLVLDPRVTWMLKLVLWFVPVMCVWPWIYTWGISAEERQRVLLRQQKER